MKKENCPFMYLRLRGASTRLKITWVRQRQHHRVQERARERMLSLALSLTLLVRIFLVTMIYVAVFFKAVWHFFGDDRFFSSLLNFKRFMSLDSTLRIFPCCRQLSFHVFVDECVS